jgi:hypothetical protein
MSGLTSAPLTAADIAALSPPIIDVAAMIGAATLGSGQTWQNMTGSRSHSTSYQNTTGRTIFVAIIASVFRKVQISTDNSSWQDVGQFYDSSNDPTSVGIPIPNLVYYRINGSVNDLKWSELR